MLPVGIPYSKLLTKFDVCSPNNFKDILHWVTLTFGLAFRSAIR